MVTNISVSRRTNVGRRIVDTPEITVRWRNQDGNRVSRVYHHHPFIYLDPVNTVVERTYHDGMKRHRDGKLLGAREFLREFRGMKEKAGLFGVHDIIHDGERTLDANELVRLDLNSIDAVKALRNRVKEHTFMGRMNHSEQFCWKPTQKIDHNTVKVNMDGPFDINNKHRILYWDIEALQFRAKDGPTHCKDPDNPRDNQEITMIGVYESWTNQYVVFGQHNQLGKKSGVERSDLPYEYQGKGEVRMYHDEKDMLTGFVEYIDAADPDLMAAWWGDGYDLPTLYHRLVSNEIDPSRMSPFYNQNNFELFTEPLGEWDQKASTMVDVGIKYPFDFMPIRGRNVFDMMSGFANMYKATTNTEIMQKGIDVVGEILFGEGKKFDDETGEKGPDFYDKDYHLYIDKYVRYLIRDLELMVKIEEKVPAIGLNIAMQSFTQLPWESLLKPTKLFHILFSREAGFLMPDVIYTDKLSEESYEAAYVLSGIIGIWKNVIALDGESLYPKNIEKKNISHETIDKNGDIFAEWDVKDKKSKKFIRRESVRFTSGFRGFLPKLAGRFLNQRGLYKEAARIARENGDYEEAEKNDMLQKAVKVLANSMYGVLGTKFAWGDKRLAAATAYFGRGQTKEVERYFNEQGFPVVGGHTDSCFIKMPDEWSIEEVVENGHIFSVEITEHLRGLFDHEGINWELEQVMDSFIYGGKNKYAGRKVWDTDEGYDIQKKTGLPRLKMSGIALRRKGTSKVGKEVLEGCINILFDNPNVKGYNAMANYVCDRYDSIVAGEVPVDNLVQTMQLGLHIPHPYIRTGRIPYEISKTTGKKWDTKPCDCGACPPKKLSYKPKGKNLVENFEQGLELWRILPSPYCGAAWYNGFIADSEYYPILGKGDSLYYIFAKNGAEPMPAKRIGRNGRYSGVIACVELEQIEDYTIDYEACAEIFMVNHVKWLFNIAGKDTNVIHKRRIPIERYRVSL